MKIQEELINTKSISSKKIYFYNESNNFSNIKKQ